MFIWHQYTELDDPAYAGSSKPKFVVIISASPQDDPILYLLTASEKPGKTSPFPADVLTIPAGTYSFFSSNTVIDAAGAGDREADRLALSELYESGGLGYKGELSQNDQQGLMAKIKNCRTVRNITKAILGV